jgi:hypothetical protein
MKNVRKTALYTFLIYIFLLLFEGIYKINSILDLFNKNERVIPLYINVFSLFISISFVAATIIIVAICSFLFLYIVDSDIKTDYLIDAWKQLLIIDIFFQVLKILVLLFLFQNEIFNINLDNILNVISTSFSNKLNRIIDLITILFSIFVFTYKLFKQTLKSKSSIINLGIFLLALNLMLYFKIL